LNLVNADIIPAGNGASAGVATDRGGGTIDVTGRYSDHFRHQVGPLSRALHAQSRDVLPRPVRRPGTLRSEGGEAGRTAKQSRGVGGKSDCHAPQWNRGARNDKAMSSQDRIFLKPRLARVTNMPVVRQITSMSMLREDKSPVTSSDLVASTT
jgi:hypothetical protein